MATLVYVLCFLTSLTCACLLLFSYRRKPARILLWSAVCFFGLALNNFFLIIDMVVIPEVDFSLYRGMSALIGLGCLVLGLVWDSRSVR